MNVHIVILFYRCALSHVASIALLSVTLSLRFLRFYPLNKRVVLPHFSWGWMSHLVKSYEANCDVWMWAVQIKIDWLNFKCSGWKLNLVCKGLLLYTELPPIYSTLSFLSFEHEAEDLTDWRGVTRSESSELGATSWEAAEPPQQEEDRRSCGSYLRLLSQLLHFAHLHPLSSPPCSLLLFVRLSSNNPTEDSVTVGDCSPLTSSMWMNESLTNPDNQLRVY